MSKTKYNEAMARPKKTKIIDRLPRYRCFGSQGHCDAPKIEMTLEEYETIALIDGQGLSQEEAAFQMSVGRTTVTALYKKARQKIADFLVHGKRLSIAGGCYAVEEKKEGNGIATVPSGKDNSMKVAISYENGEVFQHFGQTPSFMIATLANGKITKTEVVETLGSSHRNLIPWLKERGVNALICGGIGGMAIDLLKESNIAVFAGVSGKAEDALNKFLSNTLESVSTPTCDCH